MIVLSSEKQLGQAGPSFNRRELGLLRYPLGVYDRTGNAGLTLEEARSQADEQSRLYHSGIKDIKGHLEEQEKEAKLREEVALMTVAELFERYRQYTLSKYANGGEGCRPEEGCLVHSRIKER